MRIKYRKTVPSKGPRCDQFRPELELLEERIVLDSVSFGENGINAENMLVGGTFLRGAGVKIGMVETVRPGDPDVDIGIASNHVDPAAVYVGTTQPTNSGQGLGQHANRVASVMITQQQA